MRKIYILLLLSIAFIGKVNAEEFYYQNANGVKLTEHEYNIISEFYWKGYQEYISIEEYELLKTNGVFENKINSFEINDNPISLYSTSEHTTTNKSLKMSTSCSNYCTISISLNWINLPNVRSYDILGIYFDNTSLIQDYGIKVTSNKGKSEYFHDTEKTNGIGTSFKLPTDVTYLKITQTLLVSNTGSIKASYQHAKKNISLANSKKYSFSKSGIGGVFKFDTGIQSYYDCMAGVEAKLS